MKNLLFSINFGLIILNFGSCVEKKPSAEITTSSNFKLSDKIEVAAKDTIKPDIDIPSPKAESPKPQPNTNVKPEAVATKTNFVRSKKNVKTKKQNGFNEKGPDQSSVDSIKAAKTKSKENRH
jgi:hypothetical protein